MNKSELRQFGLLFGGMIGMIFGLLIPFLFSYQLVLWPWLIMLIFFGLAVFIPLKLAPVYRLWMRFGNMMQRIMTPLLLGCVYFLLLTPIGKVMCLFNRHSIQFGFDKQCQSYRQQSEPRTRSSFEKPY